jgi:hypothetical protein
VNHADVIRDLAPYIPLNIRVLCPRGHFIADMTLSVVNGQLTTRINRSENYLRDRALQQKPVLSADVAMEPDKNVVQKCVNGDCDYHGKHNSQRVALELAEAALRAKLSGHAAEHRLTT